MEAVQSVDALSSVLTHACAVVLVLFTPLPRVPWGTHTGVAVLCRIAASVDAGGLALTEAGVRTGVATVGSGIVGGTHTLVAGDLVFTLSSVLTGVVETTLVDWNVTVFAGVTGVTGTGIVSDL